MHIITEKSIQNIINARERERERDVIFFCRSNLINSCLIILIEILRQRLLFRFLRAENWILVDSLAMAVSFRSPLGSRASPRFDVFSPNLLFFLSLFFPSRSCPKLGRGRQLANLKKKKVPKKFCTILDCFVQFP